MMSHIRNSIEGISKCAVARNATNATITSNSFHNVYNSIQERRLTASDIRTVSASIRNASSYVPLQMLDNSDYTYMYAPGRGGVYASRPVDIENPEATLQKLKKLERDIVEKGEAGLFDSMNDNEDFAYLFERYADIFGDDFLDFRWQNLAMQRPLSESESDQAKSAVYYSFNKHLRYALHDIFNNSKRTQWSERNISEEEDNLLWKKMAESFAAYFGYGRMTPEERYQAILSDYCASGDTSYAATYKLLWLLEETGAVDQHLTRNARIMLVTKQSHEYASLDMTVADMAKSRFANVYYGFDADAEILRIMEHILDMREQFLATSPNLNDFGRYSDPELYQFFEKLAADLQALGGVTG